MPTTPPGRRRQCAGARGDLDLTIERFGAFGALVADVWKAGAFGIDAGTVLSALFVFLIFVAIRGIFTRLVIRRLRRWAEKTETKLDDIALAAAEPPLRFVPIVVGAFFVKEILPFEGLGLTIADNFVRSLVAFAIFWLFYRLSEPLGHLSPRLEALLTAELIDWMIRGLKVAFIFLGAATILEIWGIQVAPILAGLGLIGVAVALGAQDLFRNLIAGILIIAEQRFSRGDWIKVDGTVEAVVEAIGFRSTRLRQFDKAPVHVPNSKLADNALINYSRMTHRRIYWMVAVEYRTTVDQLRQVRDGIEAFILGDEAFASPPEVSTFVRVDRFNDSSIDIMVYCFTKTTVWGEWLGHKERLAYAIKEIVEGAGTGFAFPSRTLYIAGTGTEDAPEPFVPPTSGSSPDND